VHYLQRKQAVHVNCIILKNGIQMVTIHVGNV